MAKQTGLGDNCYVAGYDLSGDIGSLGRIGGGPAALEATGINKSAFERLFGLRTGSIEFNSYFNPSTNASHDTLSNLPTSDVIVTYCRGTTLGNPSACLVGKQINYDGTRGADGSFTFAVNALSNGYGIEWGRQLTAGKRTDTAATNGSAVASAQGVDAVYLPGTSGAYASTPDSAGISVTGDIDIRAKVALDDWTPAAAAWIFSKANLAGTERSYGLSVNTTGVLQMNWSADGSTLTTKSSTVATGFTDGTAHWVRVTLDVDNGAAGNTVTFYTSEDGSTWTQLGSTVVTAGTTSIFNGNTALEISGRTAGTQNWLIGSFFEGQIRDGIGGTVVANPVAGTSGITDSAGNTWTLNGGAVASNRTEYGLQAYLQAFSFAGTDVTVKIQHSMDNGVNDAWADLTGGGFTQITSAPTAQRIATTATTPVKKYLRVATTTSGGVTSVVFAVTAVRNLSTVVF
jgi:hypothetical protein